MPHQTPSFEDFQRLEAKLDLVIELLRQRTPAPAPIDPDDTIEKAQLLEKLNISGRTLARMHGTHFTPIRRGRKTYYLRTQLLDYLKAHNYKPEAIQRITGQTPLK